MQKTLKIKEGGHESPDIPPGGGWSLSKNMDNKTLINVYECSENLAQFTNSMLFDSNTHIAHISVERNGVSVGMDLMVRGAVAVVYNGHVYTQPSQFPEYLRELLKNSGSECSDNEDIVIRENNWFEYIYTLTQNGEEKSDGIMFEEDLSTMTPEDLCNDMLSHCLELLGVEEAEDKSGWKTLNVSINCAAYYNGSIKVPPHLTFEEALVYAKEHINEIPLGALTYVEFSDELDVENCDFEED